MSKPIEVIIHSPSIHRQVKFTSSFPFLDLLLPSDNNCGTTFSSFLFPLPLLPGVCSGKVRYVSVIQDNMSRIQISIKSLISGWSELKPQGRSSFLLPWSHVPSVSSAPRASDSTRPLPWHLPFTCTFLNISHQVPHQTDCGISVLISLISIKISQA